MRRSWVLIFGIALVIGASATPVLAVPCNGGQSPFCTFTNDWLGFSQAALGVGGTLHDIDFETLPDGTPSHPGPIYITPTFNYTAQGVTFSSPIPYPYIGGDSLGGYALQVLDPNPLHHDWITASFAPLSTAVGIYYPGHTTLYVYDLQGALIASVSGSTQSGPGFLGIVSDTPIAQAVINRGTNGEVTHDFWFANPLPEPSTALLLALTGIPVLMRRRRGVGPA